MSEYIDRQALLDAIPPTKEDKQISLFGAVADFISLVCDVPAADVAPIVHGRWIRFKESDPETGYIHMRCSVCKAYWSDPSHADHFRYCPSCGAKMEVLRWTGGMKHDKP